MRTTEQFSITLPNKMAARVRERVSSGIGGGPAGNARCGI